MDHSSERTLSTRYESLDYDLIESVIHLEHQHKSRFKSFTSRGLQRWLAILIIGFTTAMSGFFAGSAVNFLTRLKFTQVINISNQSECIKNDSTVELTYLQLLKCISLPYSIWLAWNIAFATLGSLMVTYIAPVAAGSGIPVVKCYLNGVKIPEVVRFKTYVTKLLGVVASVVSGLVVGKEGPFIHCGAAIGAGLSQGKSTTFNVDTNLFKSFRNDRDKRDFVSAGASAGVAAAFGAPIGGVLFALEEGASFWNQALTWRIFFCSMMTSFILNLLMSAYNNQAGILAFYSLVNFGLVEELDYFWFEIPIYICIAVIGGIIGASFCCAHVVITNFRKRYVTKGWMKILETVIVATITTTAGTLLILYASECRKMPRLDGLSNSTLRQSATLNATYHGVLNQRMFWSHKFNQQEHQLTYDGDDAIRRALTGHVFTFVCPPGEYSAMATLWLKTSEGVSSTFMVLQENIWSMKTLAIFLVVYYLLAVITYGLSVSSGIFIPSLLIGATGGRLVGLMLLYYFGPLEWLTQQNKFAIIGAVSVLGGIVRMTISLTVIIIEATGCISFGLPIMICLMVSKWVADSFIEGLYDLAIKMANVPFLEWDPPHKSYTIYASDVMAPKVKVLQTTETVANLVNILKSTTHNGFPVVDFIADSCECCKGFTSRDKDEQSSSLAANYYTSPASRSGLRNLYVHSSNSDRQNLVDNQEEDQMNDDSLTGSFQRCGITTRRESFGRFRGTVLRWQLLVMLELKIFNENERSFEKLNLPAFQESYPRYQKLEQVIADLDEEMLKYHVDLRSIMNPTPYTVHYSASFPRIFQIFRSLGLRHLVVIDDRNQVVGVITRKDIARYVRERDKDGLFRFYELKYSS